MGSSEFERRVEPSDPHQEQWFQPVQSTLLVGVVRGKGAHPLLGVAQALYRLGVSENLGAVAGQRKSAPRVRRFREVYRNAVERLDDAMRVIDPCSPGNKGHRG